MKKHKFLFLLFVLFNFSSGFGQQHFKSSPLCKFLKSNADSTIVFHHESNWEIPVKYMILCKKSDTISIFTYEVNNNNSKVILPHNFSYSLYEVNVLKFNESLPAVNEFLHPRYLSRDNLQHLWKKIVSLKPWNINDDKVDGVGCPIIQGRFRGSISDGLSFVLDLITKKEMLSFEFYAPDYYEMKVCPGRDGRKSILKIDKLFKHSFSGN